MRCNSKMQLAFTWYVVLPSNSTWSKRYRIYGGGCLVGYTEKNWSSPPTPINPSTP